MRTHLDWYCIWSVSGQVIQGSFQFFLQIPIHDVILKNSTHEKLKKGSTLILLCKDDSSFTTPGVVLENSSRTDTSVTCTSTFPSHCFKQLIEWWRKMEEVGGRACGMGDKNPEWLYYSIKCVWSCPDDGNMSRVLLCVCLVVSLKCAHV